MAASIGDSTEEVDSEKFNDFLVVEWSLYKFFFCLRTPVL